METVGWIIGKVPFTLDDIGLAVSIDRIVEELDGAASSTTVDWA